MCPGDSLVRYPPHMHTHTPGAVFSKWKDQHALSLLMDNHRRAVLPHEVLQSFKWKQPFGERPRLTLTLVGSPRWWGSQPWTWQVKTTCTGFSTHRCPGPYPGDCSSGGLGVSTAPIFIPKVSPMTWHANILSETVAGQDTPAWCSLHFREPLPPWMCNRTHPGALLYIFKRKVVISIVFQLGQCVLYLLCCKLTNFRVISIH